MGKITDQELKLVSEIKNEISQIVYALGELEYQSIILEASKHDIKGKMSEARSKEIALFNDLRSKYGNVAINIETGEF